MAKVDLTVPEMVTITNNAKSERVYDAGSLQKSTLYLVGEDVKDVSELTDEEIATATKVAYKNTDRKIQMYKTNTYITLHQGDSVDITTEFSEELAYFLSLNSDEISVVANE